MAKKRLRTNVQFTLSEGKALALEKLHERTGLPRAEIAARAFDWLLDQAPLLQAIILGQIPKEDAPDVLDLIRTRVLEAKKQVG